ACGCYFAMLRILLLAQQESNQRRRAPDIRVCPLRGQTSLLPVPLRGPSRWDVPVPSLLARRPCLASPCATPPLGLLTGNGVRVAWKIVDVCFALAFSFCTNYQATPNAPSGG